MSEYHALYSLYSGRQGVELAAVEGVAHKVIALYSKVLHLPMEEELRQEISEVCLAVGETMESLIRTDQLADQYRITPPLLFSHRQGNVYHLAEQPQGMAGER